MQKTVFRYGLISIIVLVIGGYLNFLIFKDNYASQETGGYITILLSLIFVYFGIRQYRDKWNGGTITYGRAFMVGILIVLFPSIAFGIFDVVYIRYLDPGFSEKYYAYTAGQMKASMSPAQYQAKIQQMESSKAMFNNVYFQFITMAATVFLIGLVVTAISSLILQKKQAVQAAL